MRILFICTANKNRSKTAEVHFQSKYPEFDIKSAGTNAYAVRKYGGVLVDVDMLNSADVIACMEQEHAEYIEGIDSGYREKIKVLNIPDDYQYMDDELIRELENKFEILIERKMKTNPTKEKRILHIADKDRSTRAKKDEAGNMIIEGYAAVFNQRSKLIFEHGEIFYEILERSAFDEVLASDGLDVLYTYEHEGKSLMARLNKSKGIKSLELSADDYGLKYRALVANISQGRDLYELVSRGDLYENSFIFSIDAEGERWDRGEDGTPLRRVSKVRGLYDVSAVVNGAYANTDMAVASRSFKEFTEQEQDEPKPPTDGYFDAMKEEIILFKAN